jgi:uncharacterized protein (DUF952 family)
MSIIYHLVTPPYWETQLGNEFYFSPTFEQEKFIHASYQEQLNATANRYYGNEPKMILLHIETDKLNAELKVEFSNSVQQQFPHIYGGINKAAIWKVETYNRDDNKHWNFEIIE